jgi:ferredoxin-NADP reductase
MNRPLEWQLATVAAINPETATVKTFTLTLPRWTPHRAGQHYDLRLVAPDGYQAQRSYSIASPPEQTGTIDLTVERLADGEVSSYLIDHVVIGDSIEVRGPIGGYFVWEASMGGPLLLVSGGSGVVPLMAILRHRARLGSTVPTRLLHSATDPSNVIYRDELARMQTQRTGLEIIHTFTRQRPPGWQGYARRVDAMMLRDVAAPLGPSPLTYVCGPTLLVETVANALAAMSLPPARIRTERFGPTGR